MAEQLPNSVMEIATSCNRVISFICVVNELVEQNLATILFISSFLFEAKIYEWQRPSPQYIFMFHRNAGYNTMKYEFLCRGISTNYRHPKTLPICNPGYGGLLRNFSQLCFNDIYQVNDVRGPGGELPHSPPLLMLVRVYVEVDGAVEGGQQVAEAGHIRQPDRPDQFGLELE